jgi:hypothetical protein
MIEKRMIGKSPKFMDFHAELADNYPTVNKF